MAQPALTEVLPCQLTLLVLEETYCTLGLLESLSGLDRLPQVPVHQCCAEL